MKNIKDSQPTVTSSDKGPERVKFSWKAEKWEVNSSSWPHVI